MQYVNNAYITAMNEPIAPQGYAGIRFYQGTNDLAVFSSEIISLKFTENGYYLNEGFYKASAEIKVRVDKQVDISEADRFALILGLKGNNFSYYVFYNPKVTYSDSGLTMTINGSFSHEAWDMPFTDFPGYGMVNGVSAYAINAKIIASLKAHGFTERLSTNFSSSHITKNILENCSHSEALLYLAQFDYNYIKNSLYNTVILSQDKPAEIIAKITSNYNCTPQVMYSEPKITSVDPIKEIDVNIYCNQTTENSEGNIRATFDLKDAYTVAGSKTFDINTELAGTTQEKNLEYYDSSDNLITIGKVIPTGYSKVQVQINDSVATIPTGVSVALRGNPIIKSYITKTYSTGLSSGSTLTIDNPFITDTTTADKVADYMKSWIVQNGKPARKIEVEFRIDPRVQMFDVIPVKLRDGTILKVLVTDIEINYNGGFRGKIKGRIIE